MPPPSLSPSAGQSPSAISSLSHSLSSIVAGRGRHPFFLSSLFFIASFGSWTFDRRRTMMADAARSGRTRTFQSALPLLIIFTKDILGREGDGGGGGILRAAPVLSRLGPRITLGGKFENGSRGDPKWTRMIIILNFAFLVLYLALFGCTSGCVFSPSSSSSFSSPLPACHGTRSERNPNSLH